MLLKFQHITIENFLSFGYAELDLRDRGYTLINGINNNPNDNALSNGSGKSSIWEAISYCLTGETIRGIKNNLINIHTEGGMMISLSFEVDGVYYNITRSKDHKKLGTSIIFCVNGEDKSGKGIRDTERIISEYLPDLTSQLIGSVVILGQGMPQKFTDNTPSGRKEVLEQLSKSDFMIEDIKNRITARKIKLQLDSKELDLKLTSIQSKIDIYEKQLIQYQQQLDTLFIPSLDEISECNKKIGNLKLKIDELNSELSNMNEIFYITQQQQLEINNEQSLEVRRVEDKYKESIDTTNRDIYEKQANINSLRNEISGLKKVVDTCPTCGQKLPDVHKVDTSDKENKLQELEATLNKLKEILSLLQGDKTNECENVEEKYKEKKLSLTNSINAQKIAMSNKNIEIETYRSKLSHNEIKLSKLQAEYDNYESNKNNLHNNIKDTECNLTELKKELVYINMSRDDIVKRLEAISKMDTIAKRDFRGFLLTNIIDYIDKRAKFYCQDVFNTDKIKFELDGNNLNVIYDDKMYENLSGGEQRRVDLISQIALRDMLCQFNNFSSNIIVLDEIFDGLDLNSAQNVINLISKRLVDVESIFIVTHRTNLELPCDSTIIIVKDENGISRITN